MDPWAGGRLPCGFPVGWAAGSLQSRVFPRAHGTRCCTLPVAGDIMVKHGALSKPHVYRLLGSEDAHVRRAAFTLLEASNPKLRRNSGVFMEVVRFIWDANPSYAVYREFSRRHFTRPARTCAVR